MQGVVVVLWGWKDVKGHEIDSHEEDPGMLGMLKFMQLFVFFVMFWWYFGGYLFLMIP